MHGETRKKPAGKSLHRRYPANLIKIIRITNYLHYSYKYVLYHTNNRFFFLVDCVVVER